MRGLDPRIHHLCKIYSKKMDPRVKPAGDGDGWVSAGSNRPGTAIADRCASCNFDRDLMACGKDRDELDGIAIDRSLAFA
jgi:hypothetical protein